MSYLNYIISYINYYLKSKLSGSSPTLYFYI
ncbi:hypothetical protein CoNPh19_CDS0069 [Staphylococcus phage S-CoN_Ph19]|nr:hypothetical protein CoNPh19_CDS0069 [Staphylococcus phage S-CoN_Ph19]WNM54785.1 hypothetical protein CoNPh21_CDS0076 [Staphylococcus phage S-CoN_Ph21]